MKSCNKYPLRRWHGIICTIYYLLYSRILLNSVVIAKKQQLTPTQLLQRRRLHSSELRLQHQSNKSGTSLQNECKRNGFGDAALLTSRCHCDVADVDGVTHDVIAPLHRALHIFGGSNNNLFHRRKKKSSAVNSCCKAATTFLLSLTSHHHKYHHLDSSKRRQLPKQSSTTILQSSTSSSLAFAFNNPSRRRRPTISLSENRRLLHSSITSYNQRSSSSTTRISSSSKSPSSSTTSLHIKFKTFDEMLNHHDNTPLLIDFYSPHCGPCKLMKGEIRSIRDTLDRLGPLLPIVVENEKSEGVGGEEERRLLEQQQQEEEDEDCSVEDVIALSTHCFDDGTELPTTTLEFVERDNVDIKLVLSADVASTLNDDDNSNDGEEEQKLLRPSGIPVFHVDTNKFPQVGAKNRIAGLPTLVLFYRGEELWRNEGMISGGDIVKVLIKLQESGWKKKTRDDEEVIVGGEESEGMVRNNNNNGKDDDEIGNERMMVTAGETGQLKKTKKRKGRRLGG